MTDLRIFKTDKSAKAAIRKDAVHLVAHEFQPHCSAAGTGKVVMFFVDNAEDKHELMGRGYLAEINMDKAEWTAA